MRSHRKGLWFEVPSRRGSASITETVRAEMRAIGVRAGLCERALQRVFRAHVGATPKWVIRRHRLQEAALRIERGDVRSLAELAASQGYADPSHLARDFKAAVGRSPRDYAVMSVRGAGRRVARDRRSGRRGHPTTRSAGCDPSRR